MAFFKMAPIFTIILISLIHLSQADDTEILPVPTSCPAVDPLDHTVHLQHESDCTKFYKCDHGEKVLFTCPDGLHFDPVLQVCNWPDQVGCTLGQTSSTKTLSTITTTTTTPKPPPTTTTTPKPPPTTTTTPKPPPTTTTTPKPPPTTTTTPKPPPTTTTTPKPTTQSTTSAPTTLSTTTEGHAGPDQGCPVSDPLNHTIHLPHECDCTKFYKCDNGKKVEFDCPAGLHFNKELQVCDWPENAGCETNVDPVTTTSSTSTAANTTTPSPTTTSSTTTPSPTTTPKPTTTSSTTPSPPDDKDPDCPWPDPLNETVHLPHEDDCTKFYKCDNGKKVEFVCPDGLHFNKELQVCDWPWEAGCENQNPTTPSSTAKPTTTASTTPSPTTTASTTPSPTTTPSTTPSPTTTSSTTPSPPDDKDPDCPWPDPMNETIHLPHEDDCTKFYKCDNGKKVEFDCPDGLHFNKELQVCDWPWDAGCENQNPTTPSSTAKPTTTASTTPSPTTTPSTTPSPTTTSSTTPSPPDDKDPDCPWPDPMNETIHLPHEDDCTKFYKCDNGKKVEFDCPDGLHFNKELQVCDWPWDAGCENQNPTTPSSTAKPTTTASTTPSPTTTASTTPSPTTTSSTTPSPPDDKDPDCPWPDPMNETIHLPHEDDCTKFYKCDNGKKVEFDCPDGLHFNKELQVCDWPWDAGCENQNPTTPSTTPKPTTTASTTPSPTTTPSTTPKPTTTSSTTPSPPDDKDPDCPWPDPMNETVHLPHEDDCTKFYKCDNGKKVEFDCPDGLHFNKELQVCDWPWDAGCENQNPTTPSTTPKPTTTASTTPSPTTTPSTTPSPTTTSSTTPSPPDDKDPECPWPDPTNETIHLPHEDDCTKFYKCDNGKKVEFDCPDGLHFNKELQVCDWPWDAGCENQNPTTPSTTAKPTTTASTTPSPTTTSSTTPSPPDDKDPECPWPDPMNETVHLPHEDCTKFYKCDNGKKVEFDCPEGLHFNAQLQVCDWPENAGCEEIPPSPTSTPSTTTTDGSQGECPEIECQNATIYLPLLSNPRQFIRCVNGVEVLGECPNGLVFDSQLSVCNLEHMVAT